MKAKKLFEAVMDAIGRLFAGEPEPELVPIRVKERDRTRR